MILLYAPDCMAYDHDVSILFSCQASVTEVDGDNIVAHAMIAIKSKSHYNDDH